MSDLLTAFAIERLYKPILDISLQGNILRDVIIHAPGIRAYWTLASCDPQPAWRDALDINQNIGDTGAPKIGLDGNMTYLEFDGSNDYLTGSLPGVDISGTETFIDPAINGLTVGGWVNMDNDDMGQSLVSRWGTSTDRGWNLFVSTSGLWRFSVSEDGEATDAISGGVATPGTWQFVVGRFSTESEVAVFVNNSKATMSSSYTEIFASNAALRIGADNNTTPQYLDGKLADVFVCASALPDSYINLIWQAGRGRAGV